MVAEEADAPFSLERGPLVRGRLVRLGARDHVLLVTLHPLVSDAGSLGVFAHELDVLYAAFLRGAADPLPPCSEPMIRVGDKDEFVAGQRPAREAGCGGGDDRDVESGVARLHRQRPYHIVGLETFVGENGHAHRLAGFVDERHLLDEVGGHRRAVGLVIGGQVVAELVHASASAILERFAGDREAMVSASMASALCFHLKTSRAAATAWFEPVPPGPSLKLRPRIVSPSFGARSAR